MSNRKQLAGFYPGQVISRPERLESVDWLHCIEIVQTSPQCLHGRCSQPGLQKNTKRFQSFVKIRKQDLSQTVFLKSRDGYLLHSNVASKAFILNQTIPFVCMQEDLHAVPDLGPSPHPTMNQIILYVRRVIKLLKELWPFKATGPDEIPAFTLKQTTTSVAPYLIIPTIFKPV